MNTRPDIIVERPYPYPNPFPFPAPGKWRYALGGFVAGVAACALAAYVIGDKSEDDGASAAGSASDETADASTATVTD
jgi:hypothetical protein